jgi:hypothetical protein
MHALPIIEHICRLGDPSLPHDGICERSRWNGERVIVAGGNQQEVAKNQLNRLQFVVVDESGTSLMFLTMLMIE